MPATISGITYSFDARLPVGAETSLQYLLVKLLIGCSTFTYRSLKVGNRINYSVLPPCPQAQRGKSAFSDFLIAYSVGCTEAEFIQKTKAANRAFFHDLLTEYSHYLVQTRRNAHTTAFAILYRLLERLSYSAPLLYSKASNDYYGTFDSFKDLFSGIEKSGELGFLRKFIDQGSFIDPVILDSTYTIDFSTCQDKSNYYSQLAGLSATFETKDSATHQLTVKFRNMCSLTTDLRNRFFHMRTGDGKKNVSIKQLGDPDDFFCEVNRAVSSYIAMLALHCSARI